MARKLSANEKLLDGMTTIAGGQFAEIDVYMRHAMATFVKGKRTGNQVEMHKSIEMAMAAAGGALLLKSSLQMAARLMSAIAKEVK